MVKACMLAILLKLITNHNAKLYIFELDQNIPQYH